MPTITSKTPTVADHLSAVACFVRWSAEHGLDGRERSVDDIWFLASEDFAPALGVCLPPRRVFLGALQKVVGVTVIYDKRRYSRYGALLGKTTIYRLSGRIFDCAQRHAA